jgi:DNA methyltransferase 1-associated protein 1
MFRHWVRANVEYAEYPYARFDIHLDPVTYSDDEYTRYLQHDTWTRSETDQLMELARKFELRWPIIYDRWIEVYYDQRHIVAGPHRKLEDLQHRYYSVAAILSQSRISQEAAAEVQALTTAASVAASSAQPPAPYLAGPLAPAMDFSTLLPLSAGSPKAAPDALLMETAAARALALSDPQHQPLIANIGTGTTNKVFDLQYERERRAHLEQIWRRTKGEELEEEELRKELRLIDTQIRKAKKAGGHILAAAANGPGAATTVGAGAAAATSAILSSAASSRNPSRSVTPVPPNSSMNLALAAATSTETSALLLDQCFASTAPIPTPQTPYLQSGRLVPPAAGGPMGLSKSLLSRMDAVLTELKVPPRPIPTKRVCDMYDSVRKDILTLLTLQKMVLQKEGQLQSKRLKLAKMGGTVGRVVDEETLLGVSTTPTAGVIAAGANRGKSSVPGTGKSTKARTNPGGGGNVSKGKAAPIKPTVAAAMTAGATAVNVPSGSATIIGGVPPAAAVGPAVAAAPGVAKMEIYEMPGGKHAKKAPPKRKKKTESKSPVPNTLSAPVAAAPVAVVSTTATTAPASAPPAPSAAATGKAVAEVEAKASGKKRPRKS